MSAERCEVCARVLVARPNPKKRRCAGCADVVPLFPLTACRKTRRTRAGRNDREGQA